MLQARLYLNRRFSVDARGSLALLLDEWNRTKLFPKAYTVLPDDGMVSVCAEQCFDFEAGVTRLSSSTRSASGSTPCSGSPTGSTSRSECTRTTTLTGSAG